MIFFLMCGAIYLIGFIAGRNDATKARRIPAGTHLPIGQSRGRVTLSFGAENYSFHPDDAANVGARLVGVADWVKRIKHGGS
jgi:hypothetical protein